MTKDEIRKIIDEENGDGFSNNVNLNGYVFTKNESFVVFELKNIDDVKVCHVKYIHFLTEKDLTTLMVYCCNFWMGNHVQFIFYREKDRVKNSAVEWLKGLGFREEIIRDYQWKWKFECKKCTKENGKVDKFCVCVVHSMYK